MYISTADGSAEYFVYKPINPLVYNHHHFWEPEVTFTKSLVCFLTQGFTINIMWNKEKQPMLKAAELGRVNNGYLFWQNY